ncbi:TolC family protein [Sphingobium sp.]|uniref:TolC family protein n=1 Tax=Sphingobium sp. TaxID=1912891 RepID=UPI002BE81A0D|nr:TolC family protein [Sphingobium sp.]HUD90807.1 TolC family protein [Sphingobium sp.]
MTRKSSGTIRYLLAAMAVGASSIGLTAHAQTMDMAALAARVVETNPEIETQRGAVRVLEARVKAARSGYYPSVEANGLYQHRRLNIHGGPGDDNFDAAQGNVEARLRLYDGLRTKNSIQVAKEELEAGQAALDDTVSGVLLDLLQTAADVRRDRQIRHYAQLQNDAVAQQLSGTSRRLQFGEATRTDESQAKARLATSRAGILSADEDLQVSTSAFEAVSGQPSGDVPELPPLAPLPPTLDDAVATALQRNQRLISARNAAEAAEEGIDFARGALAPQVDAIAGYEYLAGGVTNLITGRLPDDRSATYAGVSVRVPIFQRGGEYAEIKRSKALYGQRMAQVAFTQRTVVDQVNAAWARWKAAAATIDAARESVLANEQAADGVAKEAIGGSRTTLDVLDAQNELLNARVSLERAVRNEFVARVNLLDSIGQLALSAIGPQSQTGN